MKKRISQYQKRAVNRNSASRFRRSRMVSTGRTRPTLGFGIHGLPSVVICRIAMRAIAKSAVAPDMVALLQVFVHGIDGPADQFRSPAWLFRLLPGSGVGATQIDEKPPPSDAARRVRH